MDSTRRARRRSLSGWRTQSLVGMLLQLRSCGTASVTNAESGPNNGASVDQLPHSPISSQLRHDPLVQAELRVAQRERDDARAELSQVKVEYASFRAQLQGTGVLTGPAAASTPVGLQAATASPASATI